MNLKEMYEKAKDYPNLARFMRDMKRAGLKSSLRYYEGRFWWKGPAVVVKDIQTAMSATKVQCQYDNMGLDWIVYPKERFRD